MVWFRGKLSLILCSLQGIFIVIFALYMEHTNVESEFSYAVFQDIQGLLYLGIGFLLTFLKRHAFSGISFNLLATALGVQWAWIVQGFVGPEGVVSNKIKMDYSTLTDGDFAVANVLISYCAVFGKISHIQLVVMTIVEILVAELNEFVGIHILKALDSGDAIYIHLFSAFFGLSVSRVLYKKEIRESSKETSDYNSDIFALLGTIILWIYWPSFIGSVGTGLLQQKIVANTLMSLCASTVAVFAVSSLLDKNGKLEISHIQNATLAGGVVISACVDVIQKPYQAQILGFIGGTVSVLGFKYLQPVLLKKLKIHDTGGVNNLHALPGIVSGLAGCVFAVLATEESYGTQLYELYPARRNDTENRTAWQQGYYQLAVIGSTMGISIIGGIFTGILLKLPIWNEPDADNLFDDKQSWCLTEENDRTLDKSIKAETSTFTSTELFIINNQ
ncbi:ammonium transporter Rh type A [Octopus bimaculoides]|uniref:Ammonium transporter AmtB-like domain-containing protein n=1 Tax=Octopus bimaculoides TaxID=37653 RepID=A0A0L8FKC6_OCTBM|nr:ammonium transporter Rh type A [Octopus bimaculoides]|eukprot:XP_014789062.1 PREDICTED: ammonium transporter Rh type A-like isoform X1 [Octopus bimaculoides]